MKEPLDHKDQVTLELAINALKNCERDIDNASRHRTKLRHQIAHLTCPFEVGDVTTCHGHSYKGKPCKVTAIHYDKGWRGEHGWAVTVRIQKKDGTYGAQFSRFTFQQYDREASA